MKNFIILLNISIILWVTSIFSVDHSTGDRRTEMSQPKSENRLAGIRMEEKKSKASSKSITGSTSLEVFDFVRSASEARVMDIAQGKIAEQRATTRALKDYGTLMVTDQTRMLEDLKKIAVEKGFAVTEDLGEKKSSGLEALKRKHGKDFDDKFVKMMTIDHRRDLKEFEEALSSTDPDIKVFATKYLPLVKSHLDMIKAIKRK